MLRKNVEIIGGLAELFSFVELLRAIATALITNSHFDGVYPLDISWGGCPGVALFFSISGFVLVKSVTRESFLPWWIKKCCAYIFQCGWLIL